MRVCDGLLQLLQLILEYCNSRKAAWFENDGKGKFTTHIIHDDQAAYDIRLVDMDADGDLDALIAGQQSKNVVWYENPLK